MREAVWYGTAVAVVGTAANLLHGVAHAGQQVMSLPAWQWAYVIAVIFLAPAVAAALLWTRYLRAGAWLLLTSMAGSFVFGLVYHFLVPGPDNVFALQPGAWQTPFQVSAALVLLLQGIGCLVGAWVLSSIRSPLAGTWRSSGEEPR